MNKKLLFSACLLVLFIWLVNVLANAFYWYSAMWWFDIPMHIMGGIFLVIVAGALFFDKLLEISTRECFVTILLFVLIVGIGWEFFEYIIQTFVKEAQLANIPDSIKDIFMDLLGGAAASVFVLSAVRRYNKGHAK